MIYSKWDNTTNVYHYYETVTSASDNGIVKANMSASSELGVAADDAGHDLPKNAVYRGYGTIAKGMIVKQRSNKGLLSFLGF